MQTSLGKNSCISLDAVERMLVERGIESAAYGTDDLLIVSVLNLQADKCEELQKWLATTLTLHHSGVRVREMSELPRLANGKVDYQCLKQSI